MAGKIYERFNAEDAELKGELAEENASVLCDLLLFSASSALNAWPGPHRKFSETGSRFAQNTPARAMPGTHRTGKILPPR